MEAVNRVFTYGILQDYYKRHDGVKLISTDVRPRQKYDMRSFGAPAITPNDQGYHVNGTLLEADAKSLRMFDGIESVYDHEGGKGGYYNRVIREMDDGTEAFVYEVPQERTRSAPNVSPGKDGFLQWGRG